jgi:hypothetical protein
VEDAVEHTLRTSATVSVEATGAWDSDWQLIRDLEDRGHRVLTVWASAPLEVTLQRLAERAGPTVPVTQVEARAIWTAANDRASSHVFDLALDTSDIRREDLPHALAPSHGPTVTDVIRCPDGGGGRAVRGVPASGAPAGWRL